MAIAGNLHLDRQACVCAPRAQPGQRLNQHVIALDAMQSAKRAYPDRLTRAPSPRLRRRLVRGEERPYRDSFGVEAQRALRPGGDIVRIRDPEDRATPAPAQQPGVDRLEVSSMLPGYDRDGMHLPNDLAEQSGAG